MWVERIEPPNIKTSRSAKLGEIVTGGLNFSPTFLTELVQPPYTISKPKSKFVSWPAGFSNVENSNPKFWPLGDNFATVAEYVLS